MGIVKERAKMMSNYLHVEMYFKDGSDKVKDIHAPEELENGTCDSLFQGITHITEEYHPQIANLAAGLINSVDGKIDVLLVFGVCKRLQTCNWAISARQDKDTEGKFVINILNMDRTLDKVECVIGSKEGV